jgi:hypothetical protein
MVGSTATCAGSFYCDIIGGYLGVYPGTSVTGNFAGDIVSTADSAGCAADGLAAWKTGTAMTSGNTMLAEMGGMKFTPGVYTRESSLNIATADPKVLLDAEGDPRAVFIFNAGSTLTTCAGSQIVLLNGARKENVFWVLGTALTMGADSILVGNVLAGSAITIGTNAKIVGRAIAQTAMTCETACTIETSGRHSATPSASPSSSPSSSPSGAPSSTPSASPSAEPSASPSTDPSTLPSSEPSASPSAGPSAPPSAEPSASPSAGPSTVPSATPSASPSAKPSSRPSVSPSVSPSSSPSSSPSGAPSSTPSVYPSTDPSASPSAAPSSLPSSEPSASPSGGPSTAPSAGPSNGPSARPSSSPSYTPTAAPSSAPIVGPTTPGPQAIVRITFDAAFTLAGLKRSDVPVGGDQLFEFYASIAKAIQALLAALASNIEVIVTSVGDANVRRSLRVLQETPQRSIEVSFQVVATNDCYQQDCANQDTPNAILAGYSDTIIKSVDSGALTVAIRHEASLRKVASLGQSTAVAQSSIVVGSNVEIVEPSGPLTRSRD